MSFAKDNKNRIALGGGIYNFMKHGSDDFNQSSIAYNFEYFSKKKAFGFIKPLLGFLGTTENAFMVTLDYQLIFISLIVNAFCSPRV